MKKDILSSEKDLFPLWEPAHEAAYKIPALMQWALVTAWAVEPVFLDKIKTVFFRHFTGTKLSPQQVAEAIGRAPDAKVVRDDYGYAMYNLLENGTAVISIRGVIAKRASQVRGISSSSGTSCENIIENMNAALADTKVKKIIFDIDSPGGSVDGVAACADKIFAARGQKPMIACASGMICSAAYWIGSACDKIVIASDTFAGSIGVYSILEDWSKYLADEGVKAELIRAGKYKAEDHPYFPITDAARKHAQETVDTFYGFFIKAVAKNRGITETAAK
jgi:signal peptide peptidase SppA